VLSGCVADSLLHVRRFPLYAKRWMAAVTMAMGAELSGLLMRLRYQQNLKSVMQIIRLKYCSFSIW
jgi:hypothetical protein